jgi:putative aldouronate transport system permease protein
MKHKNLSSKLFDRFNYIFLFLLGILTLYPFWDVLVVSFMDLKQYTSSEIHLFANPVVFDTYKEIFKLEMLWRSYGNTIFVTVIGTFVNMLMTTVGGYVLTRGLKGQRVVMFLIIITMLFSGGVIPSFIIIRDLGLMNTLWSLIFPTAINTYNLILMRAYFMTIPKELEESAKIDGCSEIAILFRVFLPLSLPALATLSLFYAVAHWNEFFNAILYITNQRLYTLQLFLRSMLYDNEANYQIGGDTMALLGQPLKAATIILATLPIALIYPFFQKYFMKGVMLGAIKG